MARHPLGLRCVSWNAAAEACLRAREPGGEVTRWAQAVAELLEVPACARVEDTGEPYTTELYFRRYGVESWWQATAVRQTEGFALWLREVTQARLEERRAREALERARAREERMEEEAEFRERFIGILGHDLRSPLSAISLSARAISRYGTLTPLQQEMEQRIESSASRMMKMISDILDLTRARLSSGIPLFLEPTQASEVCRQVVEEMSAAYPNRCIVYDEQGAGEGVWDSERLAQVLSNLVANALEHGGAEVPVLVRSYPCEELLALEVHNPGPAIPEHVLATMFEPFRRSATSGKRKRSGLGLGLYIVKEIAEAHGGRVVVHSREGEGTTFTVLLPRDARTAEASRRSKEDGGRAEEHVARHPG
ncbi:sensor histidine kinase [Hyalangium rubrum]|uniref:histidine kinase n=1 Tax=Hyalangium rubrum TaxID=3103134 RepID=A0ABU5HAA1_9BACT|nr:HAMP domain-containing sensor histidine kinase [Hyalangium sp. s54d21]MDY7230019.1 HAMP domain-containing sensor histidine kinase [Hyalangium sp. s54d21]